MNSKETKLVVFRIFETKKNKEGKNIVWLSSITNYGAFKDGKITFETKDGTKVKTESQMREMNCELFFLDELCLNSLMRDWRKQSKEYEKPFVIDDSIETFEVFTNDFSRVGIMIERRENEIAIKLAEK